MKHFTCIFAWIYEAGSHWSCLAMRRSCSALNLCTYSRHGGFWRHQSRLSPFNTVFTRSLPIGHLQPRAVLDQVMKRPMNDYFCISVVYKSRLDCLMWSSGVVCNNKIKHWRARSLLSCLHWSNQERQHTQASSSQEQPAPSRTAHQPPGPACSRPSRAPQSQ